LAATVEKDKYVKPLLCYLNSSLGELCLRLSGHVYGGGVCDLNVSSAKEIQTLDLGKLDGTQLQALNSAFDEFVEAGDRGLLNEAVYEILEFTSQEKAEVENALQVAIEESLSK